MSASIAVPAATRFVAAQRPEEFDMTPTKIKEESVVVEGESSRIRQFSNEESADVADGKRARTVPCYRDVDVSTWITKIKGKNSFGSPTILIFGEQGAPTMALSHRDEPRGIFPFKLDLEPANGAQIPSFLSGRVDPSKMTEGLDFQISLSPQQVAFIERIDHWAQKQALLNSKEWFGRAYSATEIATMYSPVLKRDKDDKYAPKLKAKFVLSGVPDLLTKVTFIKSDKTSRTGAGWDFVKPLLGSNYWRGNEVRAVVETRRVWIVGKKFGLSVQYKYLVVVEKETKPTDVDFPELEDLF